MLKVESFYAPMPTMVTKDTISSIKSEININTTGKKLDDFDQNTCETKPKFNFCGLFCTSKWHLWYFCI